MRDYSRRQFLLASSVLVPAVLASGAVAAQATGVGVELQPYPAAWLPAGIRSRFVNDVNGLRIHVLEAGYESSDRPALLLLHGFPELAYSWRRIMLPLAKPGLTTVGIFTFISIWNEYILALVLLSSSHLRTMPLGIAVLQLVQFYEVDFGALFAGLVIVMLPTLLCYIILQEQITKGMTVGAVKG